MPPTINNVQIVKPDNDNDPLARGFYVMNVPTAKIVEAGGVLTISMSNDGMIMAPAEYVVNASVFMKQAVAAPGLSSFKVEVIIINGGGFLGVYSKTPNMFGGTDGNFFTGGNDQMNNTIGDITPVTGVTLSTLLDSVAGNCTPDAVTAVSTTNIKPVTASETASKMQTNNFLLATNQIGIRITAVGANLDTFTAGDLWIYVETATVPSVMR